MKARATIGLVLACVGALRCRTAAGAAIERDVVVNGGSLKNPIGAGFGWWEGAKISSPPLLQIPAPSKTLWCLGPKWPFGTRPIRQIRGCFKSAAVLPNEAFAVRFHGTLSAGPGKGQFAVAVSDVNIECDSLNTSTLLYRAPSWSDAEDAAEFPENGNSADGAARNGHGRPRELGGDRNSGTLQAKRHDVSRGRPSWPCEL